MSRRVLLVDDDPDVRVLARSVLEKAGMSVEEAENGDQLLAMLEADAPPDIIVLDISMPARSGWSALAALKTDPNHSLIPVVMLTSHDDDQFRSGAKAAGVTAYVTKPFQPWQLLEAVQDKKRDPWSGAR